MRTGRQRLGRVHRCPLPAVTRSQRTGDVVCERSRDAPGDGTGGLAVGGDAARPTTWSAARPLVGDLDVDVAIVGAGYTGLWTAYSLAAADPPLRVAVLEREHVGFGASGRNGGWCSALLATGCRRSPPGHGRDAAIAMQRAMHATVDEVGRRRRRCVGRGLRQGRARSPSPAPPPSTPGWPAESTRPGRFGFGDDDLRWLTAAEIEPRCRARRHPRRAVHAALRRRPPAAPRPRARPGVHRRGVRLHDHTAVVAIEPQPGDHAGEASCAPTSIVLATEAYTAGLARPPPRPRPRSTR